MLAAILGQKRYVRIDHSNALMPVDLSNTPTVTYKAPLDPPYFGGPSVKDGDIHFDKENNQYRYDGALGAWILEGCVNLVVNPAAPRSNSIHNSPEGRARCVHKWKKYTGFVEQYEYCEICDEKKVG